MDINDNNPTFAVDSLKILIQEGSLIPEYPVFIKVQDRDKGRNGAIEISLSDNDHFFLDKIMENEWSLKLRKPLILFENQFCDVEKVFFGKIEVTATDKAEQPRSNSIFIAVEVIDTNDHSPVRALNLIIKFFNHNILANKNLVLEEIIGFPNVKIEENVRPGTLIANFSAVDRDPCRINNVIELSILEDAVDFFSIFEGTLYSKRKLDYEKIGPFINVSIVANDNGFPSLESLFLLEIEILDVNDEIPMINITTDVEIEIMENFIPEEPLIEFSAIDLDSDANLEYDLICVCYNRKSLRSKGTKDYFFI